MYIVDFSISAIAEDYLNKLNVFFDEHIFPNEKVYDEEAYAKNPNGPLVMKPNPIKNLPTLDELNTELLRAQEEWDDRFDSYKRQRLDEYPSIREQLDMIYHDVDGWRETIKTIKDKYPKS